MDFSSRLLENAVNEVAHLPGIGKRTALRLVLHLLKQPKSHTSHLTKALDNLIEDVKLCKSCHNISDVEKRWNKKSKQKILKKYSINFALKKDNYIDIWLKFISNI